MGGAIQTLDIDNNGSTALRRTLSLLLPVFLLAALMIMVADRADASTAGGGATATAVSSGGTSLESGAQPNFRALICSILQALRANFGGGFFGAFIDQLLVAFGCVDEPSGVVDPDDDDDDDDNGDDDDEDDDNGDDDDEDDDDDDDDDDG